MEDFEYMDGTITLNQFLNESREFLEASNEIGDRWTQVKNNGNENEVYLLNQQKLEIGDDLLSFEYHVAYSVSYQVPVLFFKITRNDGTNISLDDAWNIFKATSTHCVEDYGINSSDMFKILTQMEHPVLFTPFLALHPCRTAELLAMRPKSKNRILTFISSFGPFVQLNLNSEYGRIFS